MKNICTDIEQSKKLMELGLNVKTADMFWLVTTEPRLHVLQGEDLHNYDSWENYPAWSLSALLKLLDNKAGLSKEYGTWFAYDNGKSHCGKHCNSPLEAAFDMVCWLLENKKLYGL